MKTKMPEPVAHFLVDSGSGSFAQVAPEYAVDDDVVGLYGDLQMEAYKDACVREALEQAAGIIKANAEACDSGTRIMLRANAEAVLALLPSTPAQLAAKQ